MAKKPKDESPTPKKTGKKSPAVKSAKAPLSLVTGACGFIGTNMIEVLHRAGHRIRATDLAEAQVEDDWLRGRFPSVIKGLKNVEFVPSDMTKPETLREVVKGVDYIFHIAAIFSYTAPWEALKLVNIDGTRELCNLVLEEKQVKKMMLWGAGGVYGFPPPEFLPVREEDPKSPPNNYLKSKHEQEQLVMRLGRTRGLRYSIIRPTGVYGPRCVYGMGQMLMSLAKTKRVAIPRNFTTRIPLVHVRDVAEAALFLSQNKASDGEAYNLNDDTQMTVVEFMQFMAGTQGKPFTLLPPVPVSLLKNVLLVAASVEEQISRRVTKKSPKLEKDTIRFLGKDIAYSNQKLKDLGYRFHYPDARVGLTETIEWYRKTGWV